ncbi:hypothetical protein Poli38472_012385 [Pythium oligandrum]|uniref:Uncharacterized protein n=1 Tax=Pythium oligandrum TaxID=41045 RepID=A0A8K1CPK6_PYTOL|nr:hypothetical protein Poli38472_012385 [Pythium oligandrum]|eukprot:TMW67269.1 hypothetical protein Poli38472_012385 [Pythium oligandrum]
MDEECVVDDLANRLKLEFEDGDDGDGGEDWFVNDKREAERSPSPTKSDRHEPVESTVASVSKPTPAAATEGGGGKSPVSKSNSAPTMESEPDDNAYSSCKTAFLHYFPPGQGILVMELGSNEQVDKRYGAKFFKIYLPQVHEAQTDFCLFARKRLNKNKIRFSLNEYAMSKWNSPSYGGKVVMTPSQQSKKFKLVVPKNAARVHFDINQGERKQELVVRLNSQSKGFHLFRARSASDEPMAEYKSLIQKFINPIADVRCPKTNNTLLKIEKEGDAGNEKYIITYARPFSLFVSCCIAIGVEGHQLE